jgi:hypothetical protein
MPTTFTVIANYNGTGYLYILYIIALVYLFFAEKEKRLRALLLYAPLTILLVFLLPFSRQLYQSADLDAPTYFRILWLIPQGVTTVYAGCKFFQKHRRIGLLLLTVAIALTGSLVYRDHRITKAENPYHLPQVTINVCDIILEDADSSYIYAAFPMAHVYYVRQYSSRIGLVYGRDSLEGRWDKNNPVFLAMEENELIDLPRLLEATRPEIVNYIVIHYQRPLSDDPENYDLTLVATMNGMRIYRDEVMADYIREVIAPHYPQDDH